MMRPTPAPSQRPSGLQQSPYPPAKARAVTQSQSGDHPDPSPPSATGLRIFSCRVGVARDLLSDDSGSSEGSEGDEDEERRDDPEMIGSTVRTSKAKGRRWNDGLWPYID